VVLWSVVTLVLSWYAAHVDFEKNIRKVDGTEQRVVDAEERFHNIWGGENMPAVLVATAPDLDRALEKNERLYREAVRAVGPENFTSLAPLWPAEKTRKENEERWRRFWSKERKQKLRTLLAEEGKAYGFSEQAFTPFFANLDAGRTSGGNAEFGFSERFVQQTAEGHQVLSFFPDREEHVNAVAEAVSRHPGTYIVSAGVLAKRISEVVSYDLKLMTAIAALLVLVLTYFAFGNLRETMIAMVPPVTSIVWLLGIMTLTGMAVNVANMIAGVLVIGLTSDFGIFMVFRGREDVRAGTVLAITLCTVTTVMGAGVLIFARHPALFSVGSTMVIGVSTGFLSSLFVVPKLCELTPGRPAQAETA
jgi:predicted exporter